MKISWVILTYNRNETVKRTFHYNYNETLGCDVDLEIIHFDNGSSSKEFGISPIDVVITQKKNLGVAKGYNLAMFYAVGDYIVITGCDRFMPKQWLRTYIDCFTKIPNTGIVSTYSKPLSEVPDRIRGPQQTINGIDIVPAMPLEARMFRKDLLRDAGYMREDFGLYGYEDVEWAHRLERVCKEQGLLSYTLPSWTAVHQGTEGIHPYDGKDDKEYHEFKQREVNDPAKEKLFHECARNNWPYYNPFA